MKHSTTPQSPARTPNPTATPTRPRGVGEPARPVTGGRRLARVGAQDGHGRGLVWRTRVTRVLATLSLALTVTLGLGVVLAPPAAAGFCDPDQTLPAVAGTGARGVTNQLVDGYGDYVVVGYAGSDVHTYPNGLGMTFDAFGVSGCQINGVTVGASKFLWSVLALAPLRAVGAILDWTVGGNIADALLDAAEPLIASLGTNVFGQFAPLVIMLSLIGVIIKIGRGRGQGWGSLAWMVAVIAVVGVAMTPAGLKLAQDTNTVVANATKTVLLAPLGTDTTSGSISDALVENLVGQTWAQGLMGDLGSEPAPTTLSFTENGDVPDIDSDWTVQVPVEAIPAVTPGQPTWAEVWRWTSAYTTAESSRLGADATTRCSISGNSPETIDVSDPTFDGLNHGEICTYKWVVRAALLSTLVEEYPEAYADISGHTNSGLEAGGTAAALIPALAMIAFLGVSVLMAEAKMVLWFLTTPVVGLAALRDVEAGRRWGQRLAGSVVQRISTALTMGMAILLLGLVQRMVDETTTPVSLKPIVVGVLGVVVALAARKVGSEILGLFEQAVGLPASGGPDGNRVLDAAGGALKGAGMAALGGAAGGLAAGRAGGLGAVTKGLVRGTTASVRHSHGALGHLSRGLGAGRAAGSAHAATHDAEAADTLPSQAEARAATRASFTALSEATPALAQEVAELVRVARAARDAAATALQDAQNELQVFDQSSTARVSARAADLEGQGYTPEQAREIAISDAAQERTRYQGRVQGLTVRVERAQAGVEAAEAGAGSVLADQIRAALDGGASPHQVALNVHLGPDAEAALHRYADARAVEARVDEARARLEYAYDD